jgi:hypothetical protein
MYGGLFGDLPATKNATQKGNNDDTAQAPGSTSNNNITTTTTTTTTTNINPQQQQQQPTPILMPHRIIPTHTIIRPRQQQIQKHQQLIPRKRPVHIQHQNIDPTTETIRPRVEVDSSMTTTSTTGSATDDITKSNKTNDLATIIVHQNSVVHTNTLQQHSQQQQLNDNHNNHNNDLLPTSSFNDTGTCGNKIDIQNDKMTITNQQNQQDHSCSNYDIDHQNTVTEYENQVRILHERAVANNDVYNPMIPNDVLVYWDHQVMIIEQQRIEQERQHLLQEQEMIRQQLEQERTMLLQQAIQEDEKKNSNQTDSNQTDTTNSNIYYQKIIEQEQQRTIGIGRGNISSNLPAWLIQKQREQRQSQQQQQQD